MTGQLLTARHVAEHLGLTTETVLSWVRQGKVPAIRLPSGQIRFRPGDIDAWLEQHTTGVEGSTLTIIRGEG